MTFDLHTAREIAAKCQCKDDDIDHDYWAAHAAQVLPGVCEEIARLDREVSVARNLASLAKGIVDEQADRIKQLEGWLVEERAFQIENNPNRTLEWAHSDAIDRARDQLQAEDKL